MRAKSWIIAMMAAGAVAAQAGVTTVSHRYLFDGNVTDSVGLAHGRETTAGTNLEVPQYTNDIPAGTVAGAPTKSMKVGMSFGSKKSGFFLDSSVINTASSSAINAGAGSYSVWVKSDTLGNGRYWILANDLNTGGPTLLTPTSTQMTLQCGKVGGTGAAYTDSFAYDSANQWQHVAVTWETITFTAKVYLDGALVATTPFDAATLQPNLLRIGGFNLADDANQLPNQVDGKYYDLQFYDAMLTSNEVASLAANPGSAIRVTQEIPSFLEKNRYNGSRDWKWINESRQQIILDQNHALMDGFVTTEKFSYNKESETSVTWGRGREELRGVYLEENLPTFFKRRLSFDEFDPGSGRLEWVFTGPEGGFTVNVDSDRIWLSQSFYDSYGFNDLKGEVLTVKRHPERTWVAANTAYRGNIETLDISVNHKLELILRVNGVPVARQKLLHDVTEHQLRYTGKDPMIRGNAMKEALKPCIITVDPEVQYQEMLGFGGIAIPTAYHGLSEEGKDQWWKLLKEYNLLLHREYPIGQKLNPEMDNWDKIEDATIHYYGDNFPNSEISDFSYIKKVQDIGGMNIFEFWKFPSWIQSKDDVDVDAYVRAMVSYCKAAKEKAGRAPDIVGIQNEVKQKTEVWHAMTLKLRKALDEEGFSQVKIHMHNFPTLWGGIEAAKAFSSNEEVWEVIDYAASNMYDYQDFFTDPDGFDERLITFNQLTKGKPFLSPELSANRPAYQVASYRIAFQMGQLYHKNLTLANASAVMYCWSLLNTVQPSYMASRSLFGVDKMNGFIPAPFGFQDRVFGGFSRRVMKGMRRIEVQSSEKNLLAVAFAVNTSDNQTLILMNRDTAPMKLEIENLDSFIWKEVTSQFYRNKVSEVSSPVIIQPGEIITLTSVPLNID